MDKVTEAVVNFVAKQVGQKFVEPTPAIHDRRARWKAGGKVCMAPFGSKTENVLRIIQIPFRVSMLFSFSHKRE